MYIFYNNKLPQTLLRKECIFIYIKSGDGRISINGIGHRVIEGDLIRAAGRSTILVEENLEYIGFIFDEAYFENYINFLEKNSVILDKKIIFEIRFSNFTVYSTDKRERIFLREIETMVVKDNHKGSFIMSMLINLYMRISFETLNYKRDESYERLKVNKKRILVERGINLLETTDKSTEDILKGIGIKSNSYFIKIIKEATGRTPLKYRKSLSNRLIFK